MSNDPANADRETLIRELNTQHLQAMWTLRQQAVQAFGPFNVTPVKVLVLELIRKGHARPKNLAERLGIAFPAVSTLLRELEESGYLSRQLDAGDGRKVELFLTDEGGTLCQQLADAWAQVHNTRYAQFGTEQLRCLARLSAEITAWPDKPV